MISELQSKQICDNLFSPKVYWLNKLSGELSDTSIITDYIRSVSGSNQNSFIEFEIPDSLSQAIVKFAKGSDFSIYLLLLSVLKIVLNKYTGNNDIIVGSPTYQHQQKSDRGLINQIVPLRSQITNQLTFKDFLLQVKDTTLDAYIYQNYPFDELIRSLKLPQDKNRCPLFNIVVLLENIHDRNSRLDISSDLTFSFRVDGTKIRGKVEYSESLFQEKTISVLIGHYVNALECAIANINVKISDIVLLSSWERQQVLEKFNDNARLYPVNQTTHNLFEQQVKRTPHKIAVVCRETRLTYKELNEKANQLASFLQSLGVRKGEFVGILKERDVNFSVAILAILKAGGVYVPIESTYPTERIRYMLSNSEVKIILTDSSFLNVLENLLESDCDLKSITCLDFQQNFIENTKIAGITAYNQLDFERLPKENLEESNTGIDPAYMLYTSGSTGLPKGAIIRHGGAINHIYAQFDALALNEELSFLQSAPASSDISVWQFLAPLLIGGRTVIVDAETVCNPEKLFSVIKDEKLTLVELVPVVLSGLLDYISRFSTDERVLADLKWMMVTGESASVELVNRWLRLYPSIPVVNAYGPTEAADDIAQFIVKKPLPENQRSLPIGKPLANLNLYILDSQMQVVPIGVPGEICVSGFGVGEGYWKNAAKTQASFVSNPFPNTAKPLPGTNRDLIYKTGDLGRWLPDGNIEFLGRIDYQVKIRGFRIELGEIEAILGQHSAVKETVVMVKEDEVADKRLVAYVVLNAEEQVFGNDSEAISQLRNFLQERLPNYMMPSAFVTLEALPRTPIGKVDRTKLPALDPMPSNLEKAFVEPRTAIEKTIAQIWAQVLGIEQVGIHNNFFELGGDSILCMQVIAKVRQADLNLTPKQLFENPTVAELANVVNTSQSIQIEQGLTIGEVPLTPIEHYFFEQNLLEPNHWNEAIMLETKQALDSRLLEQAVQQLLVHHDALRLRFEQTGSGWRQINAEPDERIPFCDVDLSGLPPNEQESALQARAIELQATLNLGQGPSIRVALFNLGMGKASRLLLIIHHLVVDGFSWRILVEDLENSYQQLKQGKAIALPAKTTSFKQWSQQLREYANSIVVQQELDYWLVKLQKPISRLPVDYLAGANTEASARTVSIALNVAETQALLQEVPAVYRIQINEVLLTALVQAFARWTGESTLLVNLEGHGREEIFNNVDLSRTVGLFSSIFPVLLSLGDTSHPGEALKVVKEQLRSIPNNGIGYGLLRYLSDEAKIVESLRSLPSPEVVFNYLGQFDQTLSTSSLFRLAKESTGLTSSPRNHRNHLLSFTTFIVDGQLQLNCVYSEAIHRRSTIEILVREFLEALRSLIIHCQSPDAGGITPSDFPLVQLSQDELDAALAMVDFEGNYAR
jgi:amino acid adenylation domain-containing protein/non-ribosomal peptide synthase protein (TIGR01720 family)